MPSKYVKQEPIKEDLVRNYLSGATEDDLKWLKIGLKEMKKREELLHPDEEQALINLMSEFASECELDLASFSNKSINRLLTIIEDFE